VAPDVTSPDLDAMYVLPDELCKQKKKEKRKREETTETKGMKAVRTALFHPCFPPPEPWGVNVTKKKTKSTTNELHLAPSRMPTYATNMYKKRKKKDPFLETVALTSLTRCMSS
jgi:hypothetical protein